MKSKDKVKLVYPSATYSRQTGFDKVSWYLIWSNGSRGYTPGSIRLGEGKTESTAWVDAAKKLEKVKNETS